MNYYEVLGLNQGASKEEIKKAYKKMALRWHPDKNKNSEESKKKMQEISEAYENLNGENRKVKYDVNYYDYEVPKEGALVKETLQDLDESYFVLREFYTGKYNPQTGQHGKAGETVVNDYDLVRCQRLIQLLNTVSESNKGGREFESIYGSEWKSARFGYLKNVMETAGDYMPFGWFDFHTSWERNIEQIKTKINYFRDKMGFKALTDGELSGQNESPKIPGPGKPQEIKGGKFNDYNNLYAGKNHETIRKYENLFGEVIGKFYSKGGSEWNQAGYDKIRSVNPALFKEMYGKINDIHGGFAFIPNDADSNKEKEIKEYNEIKISKMSVAINLMERLLAESKNGNKNVGERQDNKGSELESKKRKAEIEYHHESIKKSKTVASELVRLISEAQNLNNYEELDAKIKEIDKYRGEEGYDLHQTEINELKDSLGNLDKDKFKANRVKMIEKLMKDNEVQESDLDEDTKKALKRLENEQDISQINALENQISESVGKQGAMNKLNQLLKKAQEIVNHTAKLTLEQVQKVKKDLWQFYYGSNKFNVSALDKEDNWSKTKNALEAMETYQSQINPNSTGGLSRNQKTALGIALGATAVGILGIVVWARNRKQKAKK